jgi:serine/threonine protein kinase/tetratricopeptide (TPR) repeat protein
MQDLIGRMIGHYRVVEHLGGGGMGVVYRAEDTKLGRQVALKFLPPEWSRDPDARERFLREARAASALEDSRICTIHDIDETRDGQLFIAMAFYDGETLKKRLQRGRISVGQAVEIANQVAEGLEKAHSAGIIHRDIKPANLMLTGRNEVVILDFGLAKLAGDLTLTRPGSSVGTPHYMSPEQTRGDKLDPRTDLWSLGIVLFEMLTGERPFAGDDHVSVARAILDDDPKALRHLGIDVPAELAATVCRLLEKDPGRRYQTASELLADLRRIRELMIDSEGLTLSAPSQPQSRRAARSVPIVVLAVVVTGVVAVLWYLRSDSGHAPENGSPPRIVVLPFENLGPPETEYFAAGVTEEITSRLAEVAGIAVLSRTSAVGYDREGKTVTEIGEDLGVSYLLEGSVRWEPTETGAGRVRVTPQLIRVADDTHLWTDRYDNELGGIFAVQSAIAAEVLRHLEVTLRDVERVALEFRPTSDMEAYQSFLLGRYLAHQPHFTRENWETVIRQYQKAVDLDPDFALAWAELSRAHSRLYRLRVDASQARARLARQAADRAVQLAPSSPDTHLASAFVHLWLDGDRESALAELTAAGTLRPGWVEVLNAKAVLLTMQGRWEESLVHRERAHSLSPMDASIAMGLGECYWILRRPEQAIAAFQKCLELVADSSSTGWPNMGMVFVNWGLGDTREARAALEKVGRGHEFWHWVWYWQEVYEGNWRRALEILDSVPSGWIRIKVAKRPVSLFAATVHLAAGEPDRAREAFASARVELEAAVQEEPDDPFYQSSLGVALAGLGEGDAAVAAGTRGSELHPMSEEAFYGVPHVIDLAHIHVLLGQHELALDHLEYLLSIPSWLTPALYRMDPRWRPLHGNPRFDMMVAQPGQAAHPPGQQSRAGL